MTIPEIETFLEKANQRAGQEGFHLKVQDGAIVLVGKIMGKDWYCATRLDQWPYASWTSDLPLREIVLELVNDFHASDREAWMLAWGLWPFPE